MNSKIGKGILIIVGIILTAYQSGTNIWPEAVLTAILTGLGYFISNLWVTSTSDQGTLNFADFVKGAILAIVGAITSALATFVNGGIVNWKAMGLAALSALIAYISATYFTGQVKSTSDPVIPPKG